MSDDFNSVNFASGDEAANSPESLDSPMNPDPDFKQESNVLSEETKIKKHMAKSDSGLQAIPIIALTIFVVLAGVASGFGIVKATQKSSAPTTISGSSPETRVHAEAGSLEVGKTYGEQEPGEDWNKVEGVLVAGGLEGEGSHHILREGGPSQTVYITSSYIDLDPFVGHKVEVEGETFAAQKAAWLMDVGLVKVIELNATPPFEEKTQTKVTKDLDE